MNTSILESVAQELKKKNRCALCTVVKKHGSAPRSVGTKMLVKYDGSTVGTIGGGAPEHKIIALAQELMPKGKGKVVDFSFDSSGQDGMICGGTMSVFVDIITPTPRLLLIGGGHIAQTVAEFALKCEFDVTVYDEKESHANSERHPNVKVLHHPFSEIENHVQFGNDLFIVIGTSDHEEDEQVLRLVVEKDYAYLGMVASRAKAVIIKKKMADDGYSLEKLDAIFAPIGLDIGSETVPEIAISIMSELIAINHAASGGIMSQKKKQQK